MIAGGIPVAAGAGEVLEAMALTASAGEAAAVQWARAAKAVRTIGAGGVIAAAAAEPEAAPDGGHLG